MNLSIIYVNWNAVDYLRKSIASVYQHAVGMSSEIIVVDNASPREDAGVLHAEFPDVRLVRSKVNLGFAGANNLGFENSSGDNILFLNPDTEVIGPAISVMLQTLRSAPNAGIIGCKLLNTDLTVQTSCVQTFPTIMNQVLDADWLRSRFPRSKLWGTAPLYSKSSEPAKVEVISGACMLVGRDVFERLGRFSEDYFMYAEDLDLCYKASQAGYSNYFVGRAAVVHHGGKSSVAELATRMKWQSIVRFCEKHYGKLYAALFRGAMACISLARMAVLSSAGLLGERIASRQTRQSTFSKWRLILKTVLSPTLKPRQMSGGLQSIPRNSVSAGT